ncbi:hypothetical protein [Yoonia sp.]|uniref:hypothetical protein n=1 Tax=Yoonia sp. TaxID=2212373 RepID=UPI0019E12731|nr:hypothetical protein [Yoonia sp.]MBE0412161.1 hypothetical protein [Yoonia sp.]
MLRILVILSAFYAGSAFAQNQRFLSADGTVFDYAQNRHGVVLTVVEQGSDIFVVNADSPPDRGTQEEIYLGRGCEAYSRKFGDGSWHETTGGFWVKFTNTTIIFPGQIIDAGRGADCGP